MAVSAAQPLVPPFDVTQLAQRSPGHRFLRLPGQRGGAEENRCTASSRSLLRAASEFRRGAFHASMK
ncbi:hypothetical protein ACTMU2_33470 [Cupriavidus basilensis]